MAMHNLWIATEVFLKRPLFFLCGSEVDVRCEELSARFLPMFFSMTAACYIVRTNLGVRNMERSDQKPENVKADRAEPLAKRIVAVQERARPRGSDRMLTST